MIGKLDREAETGSEDQALEDAATELLRAAGAFRRGSGIRSPRAERDSAKGLVRWVDWAGQPLREFYGSLCEDLDTLAGALRLTPAQKEVLRLRKLEELTFIETAEAMGTRVWQVRKLLKEASLKLSARRHEPPVSARALFWQEIRQKQASVYRRPLKSCHPRFSQKELRKLLGTKVGEE